MMLLRRLSCAGEGAADPPANCGVRRVKSSRRSLIVGSVASVARPTVVAAPVRAELKTSDDCAVTVISSRRRPRPAAGRGPSRRPG